jgi:hypothetical protein
MRHRIHYKLEQIRIKKATEVTGLSGSTYVYNDRSRTRKNLQLRKFPMDTEGAGGCASLHLGDHMKVPQVGLFTQDEIFHHLVVGLCGPVPDVATLFLNVEDVPLVEHVHQRLVRTDSHLKQSRTLFVYKFFQHLI